MNETEIPDNGTINEKPITNSTEFEVLAANGVPPVTSTASAKAHFELKDDTDELTVPSFSLEGRELIGIIAVHIHAGNNSENGPSSYGNTFIIFTVIELCSKVNIAKVNFIPSNDIYFLILCICRENTNTCNLRPV